jgi:hypothetical protein
VQVAAVPVREVDNNKVNSAIEEREELVLVTVVTVRMVVVRLLPATELQQAAMSMVAAAMMVVGIMTLAGATAAAQEKDLRILKLLFIKKVQLIVMLLAMLVTMTVILMMLMLETLLSLIRELHLLVTLTLLLLLRVGGSVAPALPRKSCCCFHQIESSYLVNSQLGRRERCNRDDAAELPKSQMGFINCALLCCREVFPFSFDFFFPERTDGQTGEWAGGRLPSPHARAPALLSVTGL